MRGLGLALGATHVTPSRTRPIAILQRLAVALHSDKECSRALRVGIAPWRDPSRRLSKPTSRPSGASTAVATGGAEQPPCPAPRSVWRDFCDPAERNGLISHCKLPDYASRAVAAGGDAPPTLEVCPKMPRLWSGRASSREINVTSSDETSDGRYR